MSLRMRLRKSDMSALMVNEVLGNSSVESPIEINMVLKESHDISPPKLPDSLPPHAWCPAHHKFRATC